MVEAHDGGITASRIGSRNVFDFNPVQCGPPRYRIYSPSEDLYLFVSNDKKKKGKKKKGSDNVLEAHGSSSEARNEFLLYKAN